MAHTEPDKAKYLNLSFIFKFIPEFEKPRSVAVNAPIAYAIRRDFLVPALVILSLTYKRSI